VVFDHEHVLVGRGREDRFVSVVVIVGDIHVFDLAREIVFDTPVRGSVSDGTFGPGDGTFARYDIFLTTRASDGRFRDRSFVLVTGFPRAFVGVNVSVEFSLRCYHRRVKSVMRRWGIKKRETRDGGKKRCIFISSSPDYLSIYFISFYLHL
jgi:hypothetical protein